MKSLRRALASSCALAFVATGCDALPTDPGLHPPRAAAADAAVESPAAQHKETTPVLLERGNVVARIELMQATIGMIQERLQACEIVVCKTVLVHAGIRMFEAGLARTAAEDGDRQTAAFHLTEVKQIVEGDIELLDGVEDRGSIGDILALERALLNQTEAALHTAAVPG